MIYKTGDKYVNKHPQEVEIESIYCCSCTDDISINLKNGRKMDLREFHRFFEKKKDDNAITESKGL